MATTKDEKIDLLNRAIDAIIEVTAETELDFHYFVDSSESVVYVFKLKFTSRT